MRPLAAGRELSRATEATRVAAAKRVQLAQGAFRMATLAAGAAILMIFCYLTVLAWHVWNASQCVCGGGQVEVVIAAYFPFQIQATSAPHEQRLSHQLSFVWLHSNFCHAMQGCLPEAWHLMAADFQRPLHRCCAHAGRWRRRRSLEPLVTRSGTQLASGQQTLEPGSCTSLSSSMRRYSNTPLWP